MDKNRAEAGHFQPIAQMRRLTMVLPKALDLVDPIPVKLFLPGRLGISPWLEPLSEQQQEFSPNNAEDLKEELDLLKLLTSADEKYEAESKEPKSEKQQDDFQDKEMSRKRNNYSESETGSTNSVSTQLSIQPGRNLRATPRSRASSRNTVDESMRKKDWSEPRTKKLSTSKNQYTKQKHLVDRMVKERKNEHKKEVHRHYVRRMISDVYKRKQDMDGSSSSTFSQQSTASTQVMEQTKKHHHSKHCPSNHLARHGSKGAEKQSTNQVRSQDISCVHKASSVPSNSDTEETEHIIAIIKEEFKRLGFL